MTEQELDEIEKRANAATAGKWVRETVPTQVGHCHKIMPMCACLYVDHQDAKSKDAKTVEALANADFIAASREDIPALIAEIKRLRGLLK